MCDKPTYEELEHKTKRLEMEVLEHVLKEIESDKKQKFAKNRHTRRTISLMKINDELNREIKDLKCAPNNQWIVSNKTDENAE